MNESSQFPKWEGLYMPSRFMLFNQDKLFSVVSGPIFEDSKLVDWPLLVVVHGAACLRHLHKQRTYSAGKLG